MGAGFGRDWQGVFRGFDAGAVGFGEHLGELGAEEENLRGVVCPEHEDYERARGAVRGCERRSTQVEAEEEFAQRKQKRGDGRTQPYVTPADFYVRQDFEDQSE